MHARDPRGRVGDLRGRRQVLGAGEHRVEPVAPDPAPHAPDERRAVAVLRELRVEPEQAPQEAVQALGPRPLVPAGLERPTDLADRGHDRRADVVHRHVGVPLEQGHDGADPLEHVALVGVQHVEHAAAPVAQRRAHGGQQLAQLRARAPLVVGREVAEQLRGAVAQVTGEPRRGGELQSVRLLVQRDPQAEVGRVHLQPALELPHVRGDEQQPALVGLGPRVELPEHLAGQQREHATDLRRGREARTRRRRAGPGERPGHRREHLGVGAGPAGPVDDEHPRDVGGRGPVRRGEARGLGGVRRGATRDVPQLGDERLELGPVRGASGGCEACGEPGGGLPVDRSAGGVRARRILGRAARGVVLGRPGAHVHVLTVTVRHRALRRSRSPGRGRRTRRWPRAVPTGRRRASCRP